MSQKIPISKLPELLEIWDWERNTVSPDDIGKRSDVKVWWRCPNGHDSYSQSPRQKTHNIGCPKCNIESRAKAVAAKWREQKGSIVETHPSLIDEWDHEKNTIPPEKLMSGSHTKVWWICKKCQLSYLMSPNSRTTKKYGCPKCGIDARAIGKRNNLIKKYGSLAESHPLLAKEWDFVKNKDTPTDVHKGMQDERWWICTKGHPSYQQPIRDRARRGNGCPKCQGELHTSFPEQAIFYYLHKVYSDATNRYTDNGYEIDIYLPSLHVGLEYDGLFWHQNKKQRELEKDEYFSKRGIRILHIKEYDKKRPIGEKSDNILWVQWSSDYSYLNNTLLQLADILRCPINDIDIQRDSQQIWKEYLNAKAQNSLLAKFPEIAAEWDFEKNAITPDVVTPFSRKSVHWICPKCGNRYKMIIGDRTGSHHCGCPPCGFTRRNRQQHLIQEKNIQTIKDYRANNPTSTIAECARAVGLSYPTVKKYWDN